MKKFPYVVSLIGVLVVISIFLYSDFAKKFGIGLDPYLFINDTSEDINQGTILGNTSPSEVLEVAAGNSEWVNMNFSEPNILKAKWNSWDIVPSENFGIFKIVKISQLNRLNEPGSHDGYLDVSAAENGLVSVNIPKSDITFLYPASWGEARYEEVPVYQESPIISFYQVENDKYKLLRLIRKDDTSDGLERNQDFWNNPDCTDPAKKSLPGEYFDAEKICTKLDTHSVEEIGEIYFPEASGSTLAQHIVGKMNNDEYIGFELLQYLDAEKLNPDINTYCSECDTTQHDLWRNEYGKILEKIRNAQIPTEVKSEIDELRKVADIFSSSDKIKDNYFSLEKQSIPFDLNLPAGWTVDIEPNDEIRITGSSAEKFTWFQLSTWQMQGGETGKQFNQRVLSELGTKVPTANLKTTMVPGFLEAFIGSDNGPAFLFLRDGEWGYLFHPIGSSNSETVKALSQIQNSIHFRTK